MRVRNIGGALVFTAREGPLLRRSTSAIGAARVNTIILFDCGCIPPPGSCLPPRSTSGPHEGGRGALRQPAWPVRGYAWRRSEKRIGPPIRTRDGWPPIHETDGQIYETEGHWFESSRACFSGSYKPPQTPRFIGDLETCGGVRHPLAWPLGDKKPSRRPSHGQHGYEALGLVLRAELDRRIRVLDPNLAQSLRTFIISKPKFEHVASTGELHISVGVQAKACDEGATAEVRFCPIHGLSVSSISVGHGNSDAPAGPNDHRHTSVGPGARA